MASRVTFLAGGPSEHELARPIILPADVLPEFETEELSFRRSWTSRIDGISSPVWTIIAPARTTNKRCTAGNKRKNEENGDAEFLKSQKIFADANSTTQALPGAEASAAKSDLQSYLETSFLLHELDGSLDLQVTERRAHRLGLESHFVKMSRIVITHLEHIPNAAHLQDIEPQTMTVNLIVGIVSSPEARSVYTAVGKRHVSLLELVVGDETRSGFGINIWLAQDEGVDRSRKEEAHGLRQGQLVLFQNVALNSFRGQVYGQNIRRNLTRTALINGECDGEKIRAVRSWMADFIAFGEPYAMNQIDRSIRLPPDTQ